MIHYTVSIADAHAHHFEVVCRIDTPDPSGQRLTLPAWIPGSYMIRDFAKNILWLRAASNGDPVAVEKEDKQSWRCAPCRGPLEITYRVYAWDLSVRTAHLDQTHGFLNGTSLFIAVSGKEQTNHRVELHPPAPPSEWRVATTLPVDRVDDKGWGRYHCDSYESLIDHPVEMGTFERIEFDVCGVPHTMVLTGRQNGDLERLARDLTTICEQHVHFFGDPAPPVEQYLFLTMVVGEGYGGLEHRDSCALLCSREDLPQKGVSEVTESYRKFLGLCSHEYFHLWNIKRIRPELFTPYQLDTEQYTRQLWAFEGITSYHDDLALLQSGLISRESYLELLGETLTRLQRNRGREIQSVTDSSLDAWTKFYKQDENATNAVVSYYTKGAVIALMIDLHIRLQSNHQRSLRNVMRRLWVEYGEQNRGVPEGAIEKICNEITGEEIPFLQDALYTTAPLQLKPLLESFGIRWRGRPATSRQDRGGRWIDKHPTSWLGADLLPEPQGLKVIRIQDGSPAQQAGIAADDRIIALDQLRADEKSVQNALYRREPGDEMAIHLFRRDELMELNIILAAPPEDTVVLGVAAEMSPAQEQAQLAWLGTP